jgi:hypothetical protein
MSPSTAGGTPALPREITSLALGIQDRRDHIIDLEIRPVA